MSLLKTTIFSQVSFPHYQSYSGFSLSLALVVIVVVFSLALILALVITLLVPKPLSIIATVSDKPLNIAIISTSFFVVASPCSSPSFLDVATIVVEPSSISLASPSTPSQ
jgi:hypothetical protein